MSEINLQQLQTWVGKTQTAADVIALAPALKLHAALDSDLPPPGAGAALAVSALLWSWLARLGPGDKTAAAGLSLILGGAVGNAIDRLFRGHVVDFLDLYYGLYHWPAFNVADACITAGALLIIAVAVTDREEKDGSAAG